METLLEYLPYIVIGIISLCNAVFSFLSGRKTTRIATTVGATPDKSKKKEKQKAYKELLDLLISELNSDNSDSAIIEDDKKVI